MGHPLHQLSFCSMKEKEERKKKVIRTITKLCNFHMFKRDITGIG
jgi:hypothetical protein